MTALVDAVRRAAPHCNQIYIDGLDACAPGFDRYGVTSPLRQAHFLGQFLGETGGGVVLQESGAYSHADRLMEIFGIGHHSAAITRDEADRIVALPMPGREKVLFERVYGAGNPHKMRELGNRPGDGWPMRGTGPIQSTGRAAAKAWADKLGVAMKDDELWMLDPKIVFMPSLFEWDAGKLNALADQNDSRRIRRVINGGYNGLAECEAWEEKIYALVRDPDKHPEQPWQAAQPSSATTELQQALNTLGYAPALTADGKYGPATKAAVVWFQHIHGLKEDGVAGPVTIGKLSTALGTTRAVATAA